MAKFIERQADHSMEILSPYYFLQCRVANIVEKEDGGTITEISRTYNRYVRYPGDDVSNDHEDVQKAAAAFWTPEVVKEYEATLAEETPADLQ